MLSRVPENELPDAEPVAIAAGVEHKEGEVQPGPAPMDWPTLEDDEHPD
jgi:hypothetical protein